MNRDKGGVEEARTWWLKGGVNCEMKRKNRCKGDRRGKPKDKDEVFMIIIGKLPLFYEI